MSVSILLTNNQYEQLKHLVTKAGFTSEMLHSGKFLVDWMLHAIKETVHRSTPVYSVDGSKEYNIKPLSNTCVKEYIKNKSNNTESSKHYHQFQVIRMAASSGVEIKPQKYAAERSLTGYKEIENKTISRLPLTVVSRSKENVECPVCKCRLTRINVRRHIRNKHQLNPNDFSTNCLKVVNVQHAIEFKDNNNKKYKCNVCRKAFQRKSCLMRHMKQAHEGKMLSKDSVKSYVNLSLHHCKICQTYFKCFFNVLEHNNEVHGEYGVSKFRCSECQTVFTSQREFKLHGCYVPELVCSCYYCSKFGKFQCSTCNKSYRSKSQLNEHLKNSHKSNRCKLPCSVCGKIFSYKSSLYVHMTIAHSKSKSKQYLCTICNKQFPTSYTWREHQQRHKGARNYLCSTCGNRYNTNRALHWHIKTTHDKEESNIQAGISSDMIGVGNRVESVIARAGANAANNLVSVIQSPHMQQEKQHEQDKQQSQNEQEITGLISSDQQHINVIHHSVQEQKQETVIHHQQIPYDEQRQQQNTISPHHQQQKNIYQNQHQHATIFHQELFYAQQPQNIIQEHYIINRHRQQQPEPIDHGRQHQLNTVTEQQVYPDNQHLFMFDENDRGYSEIYTDQQQTAAVNQCNQQQAITPGGSEQYHNQWYSFVDQEVAHGLVLNLPKPEVNFYVEPSFDEEYEQNQITATDTLCYQVKQENNLSSAALNSSCERLNTDYIQPQHNPVIYQVQNACYDRFSTVGLQNEHNLPAFETMEQMHYNVNEECRVIEPVENIAKDEMISYPISVISTLL